jgi:hypothetical protein
MANSSIAAGGKLRSVIFWFIVAGVLAVAAFAVWLVVKAIQDNPDRQNISASRPGIPLGILGDSDSHSFHDSLAFHSNPAARGGSYRVSTFNWPEMLARLRGGEIDPGPWGVWGNRRERYALIREAIGMPGRLPPKEDYRYNFAVSGALCSDLMHGRYRQAPRLLSLMDEEPQRWQHGIIVIRIGVNSFGTAVSLERLAHDPDAPDVREVINECVAAYREAIALIHERHPLTRFVLVGIFDNAQWAKLTDRWHSPKQLRNIQTGLQQFDNALRKLVVADPRRLAFFDDQAWFRSKWGSRDDRGEPTYADVLIDGKFRVSNTVGDAPSHATLEDGHAGTAWNGLWVQSLVELLDDRFALGVPPIADAEILQLIGPVGAASESPAERDFPASENRTDSQSSTRANR